MIKRNRASAAAFTLITLAGCSTFSKPAALPALERSIASLGGDHWGPIVELKDDTGAFTDQKPLGGWWVTPIHAQLRVDGMVLITGWGRRDHDECQLHGTRKNGTTFLLNPYALNSPIFGVRPINEQPAHPADVLYCAGFAPLKHGEVLYTGGATYQNLGDPFQQKEAGLPYARVYDTRANAFARVAQPMTEGPSGSLGLRWYPTNTRLADGRVLVSGGLTFCCGDQYMNLSIQAFHPDAWAAGANPWSTLVHQSEGRSEMTSGTKDYIHAFLLPQPVPPQHGQGMVRQVVLMGYAGRLMFLNTDEGVSGPSGSGRIVFPPHMQRPSGPAWDSTAALLSTGELMTFGGTSDPGGAQRADLYNPMTDGWRSVDLGIGRYNSSSVLLPDGTVLIINGSDGSPALAGDRRQPQILDPFTGQVATYGPAPGEQLERGYHNFALLLKDGSVLEGGGTSSVGGIGCERPNLRVYYPAYLARGPRPELKSAQGPIRMTPGGPPIRLDYRGERLRARGGVVLMALGSFTHSFDQNQRYIPLAFRDHGAGVLEVRPPPTRSIAPAGDYMLYVVSEAGVPSVAQYAEVGP